MKEVVREHPVIIVVLLLLVTWGVGAPILADALVTAPVNEPLALSPRGEVRETFWILTEHLHELGLVFEREGHDSEDVRERLGDAVYRHGVRVPSGIPIPLRWSVTRASDGVVIARDEAETSGADSWSAAEVGRMVGDFRLEPGRYELRAEVLRDVPELADFKCRLELEIHHWEAKDFGMAVGLAFVAPSYFIAWPAAIMVALLLVILDWRRRGRAASLR